MDRGGGRGFDEDRVVVKDLVAVVRDDWVGSCCTGAGGHARSVVLNPRGEIDLDVAGPLELGRVGPPKTIPCDGCQVLL